MPLQNALRPQAELAQKASKPRRLEIMFFDAGGGHRSAANALIQSIAQQYPTWQVTLTNLQELLQPSDPIYQVTGVRSQDVYNAAIQRGMTYGSRPFLRALQRGIRMNAAPMRRVLKKHWAKGTPDLVVSVVPNFNRILFDALKEVNPAMPYTTIMTDIADSPPHFWMESQDQFIICGSRKATLQAHMSGFYRPERIFETSGMILRPSFYAEQNGKTITHETLGLNPKKPTAIIMFGGNGSKSSIAIADELRRDGIQSIIMCGKNEELRAALQGKPDCHAVGYTDKVADYMRLADFFVGKPGPGSMSEAIRLGLPVIIENNARTMIQERYNIIWAEEQGLGVSITSFAHISRAAGFLLRDNRLAAYRTRAGAIDNRAVFEIPPMLENIMDAVPTSPGVAPVQRRTFLSLRRRLWRPGMNASAPMAVQP